MQMLQMTAFISIKGGPQVRGHSYSFYVGGAEDVVDFWLHPGKDNTRASVQIIHYSTLVSAEHSQRLYPRYGTTSFLATVVLPRDHPGTPATLAALNNRCGKTGHGAVLEGIHAEVMACNGFHS